MSKTGNFLYRLKHILNHSRKPRIHNVNTRRNRLVKNWAVGQLHNRVVLTIEGQDYLLPLDMACYIATNLERQALIVKTESQRFAVLKKESP
jgi:hypothetical protein